MNLSVIFGLVMIFMLICIGVIVGNRFGWDAGVAASFWTFLMMPPNTHLSDR